MCIEHIEYTIYLDVSIIDRSLLSHKMMDTQFIAVRYVLPAVLLMFYVKID